MVEFTLLGYRLPERIRYSGPCAVLIVAVLMALILSVWWMLAIYMKVTHG